MLSSARMSVEGTGNTVPEGAYQAGGVAQVVELLPSTHEAEFKPQY
jgi:hypothetical protein